MIVKTIHPSSHSEDANRDDAESEPSCQCCPVGRSGHRIVTTDNYIYSLGGFNPALGITMGGLHHAQEPHGERGHPCLFKELWKFNLSTFKWQLIDDFYSVPPTIASHTIAVLGRWLFLFGGTAIPFGETPTSSLYRYDLLANPQSPLHGQAHELGGEMREPNELVGTPSTARSRWRLIPVEGEIPDERYGHTMTLRYPSVYIVGGTSGYIYNVDVYHLDLSSPIGKWTKLSSDGDPRQPVGRYRHETAFDGEKLYIFGGGTDRDAFSLHNIHTFNVNTHDWATLKSFPDTQHGYPKSRKCHSCSQYRSDVFMVGGVSGTSNAYGATSFNDIWKFSMTSATWTKYSITLPLPLYFHSAEIVPRKGMMYIFGGVTRMREMVVRTKRILCVRVAVPELLEMAWDVVCENLRDRWDQVDLNDLGIPQALHARIFE